MTRAAATALDVGYLETLARLDSPVHRLDPRSKLVTTLLFTVCVVSFDKYSTTALVPFFAYPLVLCLAGGIPLGYLARKIALVAPFAIVLGAFNPLLDREPLAFVGSVELAGGWFSYFSILMRFILTVWAALSLVAISGFNRVCSALQGLGVPRILVLQLMFLYRYLFVLTDETSRLLQARSLRNFGRAGAGPRHYGAIVGHLLLRTLDRAQRIHQAMLCRGFDGELRVVHKTAWGTRESLFFGGWTLFFVVARLWNLPEALGLLVMGGAS